MKSRHNERDFSSVTTLDNLALLPDDYENPSIVHFGGRPLRPKAEEELRDYLACNPTGDCKFFAEAGASFIFAPAVTDGTALQGRYFCRLEDLSATTLPSNELFRYAQDLFIYAALAESGPYFTDKHATRIPFWEAKYVSIRDRLNLQKNAAAFNAGRMSRSPSTSVIR